MDTGCLHNICRSDLMIRFTEYPKRRHMSCQTTLWSRSRRHLRVIQCSPITGLHHLIQHCWNVEPSAVVLFASSYCELTFYGKERKQNRMKVHLREIPKGTQANVTTLSWGSVY